MDPGVLRVFLWELDAQCEFVLLAAEDVNQFPNPRFWFGVQNLATAAGNISRILWGHSGKLDIEREPIRLAIGVTDASPLHPTDVRDGIEHFVDRIDIWARDRAQPFAHRSAGTTGLATGIRGATAENTFLTFDTNTGMIAFNEYELDIRALVAEVQWLIPIVHAAARS